MDIIAGLAMLLASLIPGMVEGENIPQQSNEAVASTAQEAAPSELPSIPSETIETLSPPNEVISPSEQAPVSNVFEDKSDEEVIALAIAYLEELDTLNGKFYQQAPSGTLSTGKFFIRRPGLLRFEYDPPTPLLIVANGGVVFVRDEALKTTDSYPVGRTPLKFLLRKKIDLDKADIVNLERGPDAIAITLSARDEETEGELSLVFTAPEINLIRWVVRDARNGLTIVDLTDVVQDERLNNNLFRIPETQSPFLKN